MPEHGAAGRLTAALSLAGTSLGFGVVQLDVTVVNVAVPSIRADLGGSIAGAQWVVDAYTVTFAALILSAGAVADRVGAKRLLMGGFVVFTLASAACGLAPGLGWLVAFRALLGVGAALLVPSSLTVLNHAYPDPADRTRAVGLWAAGASVGLSGGPLVGGVLIALSSWRAVFWINLPLGLLGACLVVRCSRETPTSGRAGVDPLGQLLGVGTLVLLTGAVVETGVRGFADPLVLGGLGAALLAALGFVAVERRHHSPLLPLSLFGARTFACASVIGLIVNIAFYGLIFVLGLYFQTAHGYSPLQTGLAFAPTTAVVLVANVSAGRLVARFGTRTVVTGSTVALATALAGLEFTARDTSYAAMVGQLTVLGATLGLIVPAITSALLGSVDPARSGVASGTLNTARQTGSVVGVALFGAFAATSLVHGLHVSLTVAMALVLLTAGVASGLPPRTADVSSQAS